MNKTVDANEVLRIRKQMIQQQNQIADLQEELEEKNNLYMNAIRERDQFKEKLNNIKGSVGRVEEIVQDKVNLAMDKERKDLLKLREENQLLKDRIGLFDKDRDQLQQREKQLMQKINELNEDLKYYSRNVETRDAMKRIDALRDDKESKERHITQLTQEINDLSNKCEDLLAETRTLRKMANVPANYGINLEQVKLYDREKIDDYKRLIKQLQEDNYSLEQERARLKHMIKQQSILYKQTVPSDRYKDLTQDQLLKVDKYVLRLKQGETEEPADFYKLKKENQKLRDQLEALNSKGFEFIKAQIEYFFKQQGFGDSNKQLDKLMIDNEELRKMIRELLQKGISGGPISSSTQPLNTSKFRPPMPHQSLDGDIASGHSYKFGTDLEVVDRLGRPGIGETNRYDTACLQLQLVECLEILKRKDENMNNQQAEVDLLYRRVRDYLLTQDQLYKDYVTLEKGFKVKQSDIELQLRNVRDSLAEEQVRNKNLEEVVRTMSKGGDAEIRARIIELTKQNSILEVNMMRLTRKYQTLAEQEDLIRREYHNKEADMAEKDRFVQDRINKLKEWKARAIQQLKFLFSKLRMAVPLTEFQTIGNDLDIFKHKNADLIDRNAKMAQKLAKLHTKYRENQEAEEKVRNMQEIIDDAENELEVVRKRLENLDPDFRYEVAIFNNMVATLKRARVSPSQAFEEFDRNNDGKLQKDEFYKALTMMKIDVSQSDFDMLWKSMDVDSDGYIQYKEFIRKLARHGVRSRTSEEQIIYLIIEGLKRSQIKHMHEAFDLIDKEGCGTISRDDFKDIFRNLKLKISEQEIDKFIDHFWKDKVGGIDYHEFLRIFNRYQVRLENELNPKATDGTRLSEEVVRYKQTIFREIDKKLKERSIPLKSLFSKVDVDRSERIEQDEFISMFEKMQITLINRAQIAQIFDSIDFDGNGYITFPEFKYDFDRYVTTDVRTLIREEKEKVIDMSHTTEDPGRDQHLQQLQRGTQQTIMGRNTQSVTVESQLKTRILILESREKHLSRKLETALKISSYAEQSRMELQKSLNSLEKNQEQLSTNFIQQKEDLGRLQEELSKSVRKEEAEQIKKANEQLQTELVETKSAMLSFKNMTEVIADQAKSLKLIIERRRDENENLLGAVRELQAQSVDQQRLGKLYYVVMLSRWQEAAANKKYDMILSENKELRKEIISHETVQVRLEYDYHESENSLQEVQLRLEKSKQSIANTQNLYLSFEKAEQFNLIIEELSDEKESLEEAYLKVRTEFLDVLLRMDQAEIKAEQSEELLKTLQNSTQQELSDRIIEVSDKIKTSKLEQLRATRQASELNERNNYLARQLKLYSDNVKKLEEQVSDFESRMHKREEEFRRADNERMRRFFNARFDDIGGALQRAGPDSLGERRQVFNDQSSIASRKHEPAATLTRERSENLSGYGGTGVGGAGGYGKSTGTAQTDAKILENKCKRLQEELKNAGEILRQKELIIKRFSDWQLADKYLSQDEVLRDAIDRNSAKTNAVQEQEQKEMADAAFQTIKTLQEMLDQKKSQLKSKEMQIEKMRKQMVAQRDIDAMEIGKLQQQSTLAAGTTLNKLHEIVIMNEGRGNSAKFDSKYERLTREELQKAMNEKDHIIQQINNNMKALEREKVDLMKQKERLNKENGDLEGELMHARQSNEVKTQQAEVKKLMKQLNDKNSLVEKLKKSIDDLNQRMISYEKSQSDLKEDTKGQQIVANTQVIKLKKDLETAQDKVKMMEASRNQKAEELKNMKVKEQEMKELLQKALTEKEQAQKLYGQKSETLDQATRAKERLQIQLNAAQGEIRMTNVGAGLTYEQLQSRVKELENDIVILQCQTKTVIAYNKESATFEYIGEPIFMNTEQNQEVTDIDDMLNRMRTWLNRNDRLTVKSIFESIDKQNFGELPQQKFELALEKLGIRLKQGEKMMFRDYLDPKNIGFLKYPPLVRELIGIPQLDFISKEILKVVKLVESRDLERNQFHQLLDPARQESLRLDEFQRAFQQVRSESFTISDSEVETIFKGLTKSQRTMGLTVSMNKFSEKLYQSVDAHIIEKVKDSILKTMKPLSELFTKYDSNKDGQLEYQEMENLLLESQVAFKPSFIRRLFGMLDPNEKKRKVTYESLKFYVQDGYSSQFQGHLAKSMDFEPSLERPQLSQETSNEELSYCKSGARKILSSCQNNLLELLQAKDKHNEGIVSRDDIKRMIEEQKIMDLTPTELNLLMKLMDKTSKGYVSIDYFVAKIQELSTETKSEVMLRRFANSTKHQSLNLKLELGKFDVSRSGRIEKRTFHRALKQLSIALTDEEIDLLFSSAEVPDMRNTLDIKTFLDKIQMALKAKPLPTFLAAQPKTMGVSSKLKTGTQDQSQAFGNWEAEKKYKKKLEALQQQIEECKKETQAAEKQAKHWQEVSNKLEKEKNILQTRLVDLNAKPPGAARMDSMNQGQLEELQQLKDQLFYMQEENLKKDHTIAVQLKSELSRVSNDRDKFEDKLRNLQDHNRQLESQIQRLIGKPMDDLEQREEQELWREKKIQELQSKIDEMEREQQLNSEHLFTAEEKLLDLRFVKENFDLQVARLQKRITDLEQYKLASAQFSAVQKHDEKEKDKRDIEQSALYTTQGASMPKKGETNKLRFKGTQSVAELEMVVESLKRVVEKLSAENDQLKNRVSQSERKDEKLKSEKQLRQRIQSLELELHSHEMKDVNLEGKDKNIKKLLEANKELREKLSGEVERYQLLEKKYKDVLVKYDITSRANEKNFNTLFHMSTGGQHKNHEEYLMRDERNSKEYDGLDTRNFEDVL